MLSSILALLLGVHLASADERSLDKAIWMGNANDRISSTNNIDYWKALKFASLFNTGGQTSSQDQLRWNFNFFRHESEENFARFGPNATFSDDLSFANT